MFKKTKKRISKLLISVLLLSNFFMNPWVTTSEAEVVGSDDDGDIVVTDITYGVRHNGFEVEDGYFEIQGSNLEGVSVKVDIAGLGYTSTPLTLSAESDDGFLKYTITDEDLELFTGVLRIGSNNFSFDTSDLPIIDGADKLTINEDDPQPYTITFTGNNLDQLNTGGDITGVYGRGISTNSLGTGGSSDALTLTNPTAPGNNGYQDITITKFEEGDVDLINGDPNLTIEYFYDDAFRIVEDLNLTNLNMFPNAAPKGGEIFFTADNFSDAITYDVYFVEEGQGELGFVTENQATTVELAANKTTLNVTVPDNEDIDEGTKDVYIVQELNAEIVATYEVEDPFYLIEASYLPTIDRVNPDSGPDTGSSVQIIGDNLITLDLPLLTGYTGIDTIDAVSGDTLLDVEYDLTNLYYNGVKVDAATREVQIFIGKQVTYERDDLGDVKYSEDPDNLFVITGSINDAADDPLRDVVIETTTVIEAGGTTYTFKQGVTEADGYEFVPSSVEPTIDSVTPELIHVDAGTLNMKENTMLAIKGSNFMVNKYTDGDGDVQLNYPVILIQNETTLGDDNFILLFDKNAVDGSLDGRIYYDSSYANVVQDADLTPIPVDMTVLNSSNEVVDGTPDNEFGNKILVYLPEEAAADAQGSKNLQVINPKRESNDLGQSSVAIDILEFIVATDEPVIETLEPNISTVEGGTEITITGTNFQEGVKVIIDGEEVSNVSREIDIQGSKVILTFNAPAGREGVTQLQVLNSGGGLDVRDFYYIQTFDQDPVMNTLAPEKGTEGTVVLVDGENFFRPDPTAGTTSGIDAYRLIGTRILMDGEDINTYNYDALDNIDFVDYSAPNEAPIFTANIINDVVEVSPFYKNAYIYDTSTEDMYDLTFDADGNPMLYDGNILKYAFEVVSNTIHAFNSAGTDLGEATVTTGSITFGSESLTVNMDNQLLSVGKDSDFTDKVRIADYWYSIILEEETSGDYYTLTEELDGDITLTNGALNTFSMELSGGNLVAIQGSNTYNMTVTDTNIAFSSIDLKMLTPYEYNGSTGEITGNRVQVITSSQIQFKVPLIVSGQGYKDVTVKNPDTKDDTITDGFFYYTNPATNPVITLVDPNFGSVDGDYLVTLFGSGFDETSRVFVDGVEVSSADINVNLDYTELEIVIPAYTKDLTALETNQIWVPIVVVNQDGGSASKEDAFLYVVPSSEPQLTSIVTSSGSTTGGAIVTLKGYDFRYFEPYTNETGGPGYDVGDPFINLNGHLNVTEAWDNLTTSYIGTDLDTSEDVDLREPTAFDGGAVYSFYDEYFDSPILPKVYFGSEQAKIVDFADGIIRVVAPSNEAGTLAVYLLNNDGGISNSLTYTYQATNPTISYINPDQGARIGQETRDIYGSSFVMNQLPGYDDDDSTVITDPLADVDTLVRFDDISNRNIAVGQENDGTINAQRAVVELEGNLTLEYRGDLDQITVSLQESGTTYTRVFTNYDDSQLLIPVGMLQDGSGNYYVPFGDDSHDGTSYNSDSHYELILVEVDEDDRRFYVERGYAPSVTLDSSSHLVIETPSYHTIGTVQVTVYNSDGGTASTSFTYTNPDSEPRIDFIEPFEQIEDESAYMVQSGTSGGIEIEIQGTDFRDDVKVYINTTEMEVVEISEDEETGNDVIIAVVPAGSDADIDERYPIIVENTDGGIANSTDQDHLISDDKWPIYFIYREELSGPTITSIEPSETSQYGGNQVTIVGRDFRDDATVIIGTSGGVPVTPEVIAADATEITITIPEGLSVGTKNVQVINSDFGTTTFTGGLTIVSYPIIASVTADDGSSDVEWVSVEGGTEIVLTGENFDSGANVYFGGTRTATDADEVSGTYGLFRDDTYYVLEDVTAAQAVTYVSSTELRVTMPEVFEEGEVTITVVNGDNGLSDNDQTIVLKVPVPSTPVNLEVDVVADKYIRLYDYTSSDFDYFEIYVYIGDESRSTLKKDNYKDFQLLDTTTQEPYKITKLPGLEDMHGDDDVNFVIKAVNKYGPSDWSNIAYLDENDVDDIEGGLGQEDFDSAVDVPEGETYVVDQLADQAVVTLSQTEKLDLIVVDLQGSQFEAMNTFEVNVPEKVIRSESVRIYIQNPLVNIQMRASNLYTSEYLNATQTGSGETYANVKIQTINDSYSGHILRYVPRGKRVVGDVEGVEVNAVNNVIQQKLNSFNGTMLMGIQYDAGLVSENEAKDLVIYQYDEATAQWTPLYDSWVDTTTGYVYANVNKPGYYVILQDR